MKTQKIFQPMIIVNIANDYTLLFIYARKNGYTDDTLKSFLKKKNVVS